MENHSFTESRKAELDGLKKRETFKVVDLSSVPRGTRIYGSHWVDVLKDDNGKFVEKSRLVAQNFRDRGALSLPTKSPTISRAAQRLTIALASSLPAMKSFIRDISQAYVQSETRLERPVYVRALSEMGLGPDKVLLVTKPLYGIPESDLHWFITYHDHHTKELVMNSTRGDSCLLYKRDESGLSGITALQVDDSYGHGTDEFFDTEENGSRRFKCKPRQKLETGISVMFNGCHITAYGSAGYGITQSDKRSKLKPPTTREEFVSNRALAQYIGCCTRPDICAAVQLLASATDDPSEKNYTSLQKIIKHCNNTTKSGLRYIPLDLNSIRFLLFTDASFANTVNLKSQLGFVLVLVDKSGAAKIVHYGSSRCSRVARSVMAAEIFALIYGFDNSYIVHTMLEEILGKPVKMNDFLES